MINNIYYFLNKINSESYARTSKDTLSKEEKNHYYNLASSYTYKKRGSFRKSMNLASLLILLVITINFNSITPIAKDTFKSLNLSIEKLMVNENIKSVELGQYFFINDIVFVIDEISNEGDEIYMTVEYENNNSDDLIKSFNFFHIDEVIVDNRAYEIQYVSSTLNNSPKDKTLSRLVKVKLDEDLPRSKDLAISLSFYMKKEDKNETFKLNSHISNDKENIVDLISKSGQLSLGRGIVLKEFSLGDFSYNINFLVPDNFDGYLCMIGENENSKIVFDFDRLYKQNISLKPNKSKSSVDIEEFKLNYNSYKFTLYHFNRGDDSMVKIVDDFFID